MANPAGTQLAWEAVIGLETHVQLGTNSKIFTSASTAYGDDPNTHIDPVVCGLPGTLPVLNRKVLEYAVKAAMGLNLNIAEHCKFDRKQYFYPDLPKNYQITQYDQPIAEEGWIEVEVAEKGKDTYLKKNRNRASAYGGRCRQVGARRKRSLGRLYAFVGGLQPSGCGPR